MRRGSLIGWLDRAIALHAACDPDERAEVVAQLVVDDADRWEGKAGRGFRRTLVLEEHASERAFLDADPRRRSGRTPDIAWRLYDEDPSERWAASYAEGTGEIYVFKHVEGANEAVERFEAGLGSMSGPCLVVGHCPNDTIVRAALLARGRLPRRAPPRRPGVALRPAPAHQPCPEGRDRPDRAPCR